MQISDHKSECSLCPRDCHANRAEGALGYCKSPWHVTAARAALHMWEEPVISGVLGSGTVFFSGCGLGCVFCQNRSIAEGEVAREISLEKLSEIFLSLQEQGAHNINLVTGSHYVPQIAQALRLAKAQGLHIPVVYNTGSYEKVETLKLLEGLVDIYLPDLKYMNPKLGARYANAPDYYEVATKAIAEMYRQVGAPQFEVLDVETLIAWAKERGQETTGYYEADDVMGNPAEETNPAVRENTEEDEALIMKKGVIVRHLMLPGGLEDSKAIIRTLLQTYGDHIFISLMNQYTPCNDLPDFPELMQKIPEAEYEELVDYAIARGINNGFIQEGEAAEESFIPAFDYLGL